MSFGRKGLAPGQMATAVPGGFGRAQVAQSAPDTPAASSDDDDIAAKREAFIASERLRRAQEEGTGSLTSPEDMMAQFRNSAQAPARPAQRMAEERVGELGLPVSQEEQIRAAARGMASSQRAAAPAFSGNGAPPRKTYMFGDPAKRSLGIAYLIWFVIGQTGLHRAYCGNVESAFYQVGLLIGSVVTLFIFPPLGIVGFAAWVCWIIGDLFMMPGMLRKFKEAHTYHTGVFA